jgi:hypothetical protein
LPMARSRRSPILRASAARRSVWRMVRIEPRGCPPVTA